jgi:hypothetical protein
MDSLTHNIPDSGLPQPATTQGLQDHAQPAGRGAGSVSAPSVSTSMPPQLSQTPAVVEDEAAVEQQWIQKARDIIAQTKEDPFNQARLLMELKTEYLAARYGRRPADNNIKP